MHNAKADLLNSGYSMWTKEIVRNVKNAIHGWKLYFTHPVFSAGLALASIFMTVLGVDNITYGFCMAQCIQKSILGGLLGLTAIVGILGSLTFPVLRKRFGLHFTGLIGFTSLLAMLSLCVISIGLDGSPFDPFYFQRQNITTYSLNLQLNINKTKKYHSSTFYHGKGETWETDGSLCYVASFISIGVFLTGIILARFGLWISDLTVTQVLQVSRIKLEGPTNSIF